MCVDGILIVMPAKTSTTKTTGKNAAKKPITTKRVRTAAKKGNTNAKVTTPKKPIDAATLHAVGSTKRTLLTAPYQAFLGVAYAVHNPMPLLPMMQTTARATGMFFVVLGAFYTLYFAQLLYSDTNVQVQLPTQQTQLAQTTTATTSDTETTTAQPVDTDPDGFDEVTDTVSV